MEVQKFRIKRINPDIYWEIPCSGGTNFWPINTSTNCSGITMYNTTGVDVMSAINGDILNTFPEELKHCSPSDPCVILWNTGPNNSPNHCTSVDSFLYILFKGLHVTLLGTTYSDSFNQTRSVINVGQSNNNPINITPNTFGCECLDQLGPDVSKVPIFLSQDFNDIGHYSVWDGNISQQEVFANFVYSGVSNSGYGVLVSNTTDFGYYEQLQKSPYTIDWGDGTSVQHMYFPNLTTQDIKIYPTTPAKYKVTITQDSPWGPLSTEKILSLPLETYPFMAGPLATPPFQMDQSSPLTGPPTYDIFGNPSGFQGSSTGYFNDYPDLPLDSATHINQYSGMTFGPGAISGKPCFTVSGITDSILGNFQTYTNLNSPNLPPGFNVGVVVPIGGDVLDPITNGFLTGVYGVITDATTVFTAYTISSAANSSGTWADGDTPINFWDFTNGITIFEATSCGLDNLAWGAEECIACPSGDCEYCTTKDEYVDRGNIPGIMGTSIPIGPGTVIGDWSPSGNYAIGDIVYDVTYNSCCCFMAVINISSSDPWYGVAPVMMEEGVYNDGGVKTHVWEACTPDCVACPPGTNTPCNDFTLGPTNFYSQGNFYNAGDFVEGTEGNCYQALVSGTLDPPTGYTMQFTTQWDYIGCVSWVCPIEGPVGDCDVDCIGINGIFNAMQMNSNPWGWLGGPWDSTFASYNENDTVSYNGVCYVCLTDQISSSFPCSEWNYAGTYGEPDISPHWQACPLPSSTSLDCIMISGATLDTVDQFGNPITVTGEMFWGDCDTNLNDGTCFDSRWVCTEQYTCQGCYPILSDDPLYFTPLSFATEPLCSDYCEPIAYSCTTPAAMGVPCCDTLGCDYDATLYINTMISVNAINNTFTDLAYNYSLYLSPPYLISDCNNGVLSNAPSTFIPPVNLAPIGPIAGCCIDTVWTWDCESGCQSLGGIPTPGPLVIGSMDPNATLWPSQSDCESNMLIYFGVSNVVGDVPCSWWCDDPYIVYNPPTPGPYQSPCIPWYTLGGPPTGTGPYLTEADCVTACTVNIECWTCDCNAMTPCTSSYPNMCPTLISTSPNTYGPDPTGGLNGIPSYPDQPSCLAACICDFGWDCFTETGTTTTPTIPPVLIGCKQGISQTIIAQNNWQVTDPDPLWTGYDTFSACCYANQGCCYADCDDDLTSGFNMIWYPNGPPSPILDWPCSYDQAYNISTTPCNDPTSSGYVFNPAYPWCFMFDCTNALCPPVAPATTPTCCDPTDETCDCACGPEPVNSTGAWNSLFQFYDEDDAVYWGDTDTDFCCFRCDCPIILPQTPPTPGDPTTYDCNHFTPGDPPAGSVPNCWVSCNLTPGDPPVPFIWQAATYDPCDVCDPAYTPSWECSPDGCVPSACDTTMGTGHIFNCYNNSTCDNGSGDECDAQCFCIPGTNPCIPMCATYQQELILASGPIPTDCPPNVYAYNSYNECMGINPVNALLPNCCPGPLPPQWYCDDSSDCSPNAVVNVDGTGCVEVNDGDALYQNPLTTNFTSLGDCQPECTWCCDPNGVSVCTFVGNVSNCAGTFFWDALGCFLATTTTTPCDCSLPPTEYWCHYDYSASLGGCVSNISTLLDTNLFGVGAVTRAVNNMAYFTSLGACQEACRFCCDCDSVTSSPGTCYLNWYCAMNQNCNCMAADCYATLIDCIITEEPCVEIYLDYYCDDILGCIVYPVINTLMSGPYVGPTAQADCQLVCQFECNGVCQCEFTAAPTNPVQLPPCYTLACCHAATNNNQRCCECEKCLDNTITYHYEGSAGVLLTYSITLTSFNSTPLSWTPTPTANGGTYINGDVVTQDGCCYVMVLGTGDWALYDTTMLPSDYYNLYMNALNTSGLPAYGTDLMWIPCDPECPPVVYEERWWCDDNNPQYPYQITNCIEEYPYINTEITANASYGDNVWGTDAGAPGSQVSYNGGGTPFSSLEKCQEWCKYCCEPTTQGTPCCCCEDDGFGNCVNGTQTTQFNPTGLPCNSVCAGISQISCPQDCCCCEDDGQGGCVAGTTLSYPNPQNLPCRMYCTSLDGTGPMVECPDGGSSSGNCKICCKHLPEVRGTGIIYYIVQGAAPCNCNGIDTQVSMGKCNDGPVPIYPTTEGFVSEQIVHQKVLGPDVNPVDINLGTIGSAPVSSGPPVPCCIICQNPMGSQYIVSNPNSVLNPCKCSGWLDINVGPCTPPSAPTPCELDWGCATCTRDCYDSFYSCMTLTNNCEPIEPGECDQCVGQKSWYHHQAGLLGYWNPTVLSNGSLGIYDNSVPNTFDGWDGTNVIPHTTVQMWSSTEPYWGEGQIVKDPLHPGCCWVRTQMWDAGQHLANMLPDQYSPSEHWCNWLSGNSADGLNLYTMGPSPNVTTWQGQGAGKPWWVPCDTEHFLNSTGLDEKCFTCGTGGTPTLTWKCIDGNIGGCVQAMYSYSDPDVFVNQVDCDALCKSYLCNSSPYWWAQSKCSNTNHSGVVGTPTDYINWHINVAPPFQPAIQSVYTNTVGISSPGQTVPCPIPPPTGVGTGGMCSSDHLFYSTYSNAPPSSSSGYPPNPNGGTYHCHTTWGLGFAMYPSWGDTIAGLMTEYNTDVSTCTDFVEIQSIMRNLACEWVSPTNFNACVNQCNADSITGAACAATLPLGTATKYNDSGLYLNPSPLPNLGPACQIWDPTLSPRGAQGCCPEVWGGARPCHCTTGPITCDCWILPGTGTTGGPSNVWDDAWPISDYTGCTQNCCEHTICGCCEPDLMSAGLLAPGQPLTHSYLGGSQWSFPTIQYAFQENECFTYPGLSGFYNYGSGTLSGDCCVCCVAGGPGGNPDPFQNGVLGDCFWEATTTAVYPNGSPIPGHVSWANDGYGNVLHDTTAAGGTLGTITVQFHNHTGQWVTCGVKEGCESCGTPLTLL